MTTEITPEQFSSFIKAEKPSWLSGVQFSVMVVLLQAKLENTSVWLSVKSISERSGVCSWSVHKALKTLKETLIKCSLSTVSIDRVVPA